MERVTPNPKAPLDRSCSIGIYHSRACSRFDKFAETNESQLLGPTLAVSVGDPQPASLVRVLKP